MIAIILAATLAPHAPPRTILFVGNSFTFGALSDAMTYRRDSVSDLNGDGMGGAPAMFKRFADQAGLRYRVSLETAAGQTLTWHLHNKRAFLDRRWDAVVLQQYSTLDPDLPGNPAGTISAVRGFIGMLRRQNPKVDVSLVATWSRPDLTYPAGKPWSGQPIERMALDLRRADDRARASNPMLARVIPVGEAFNCAIARNVADPNPYDGLTAGQVDLWASDHYHASTAGYYLEALTIFAAVTHSDPRNLGRREAVASDLGIPPSTAVELQDVAMRVASTGRCNGRGSGRASIGRRALGSPR